MPSSPQIRFQRLFVLALAIATTGLFLWMIADFLDALLLAALFAVFLLPLQEWLSPRLGGRENLAATLVLLGAALLIVFPLLGIIGMLVTQAAALSEAVAPWVQAQLADSGGMLARALPEWVPGSEAIAPYETQITSKLGEFAGSIGSYLVDSLSRVTQGTLLFFLGLFVMLYAVIYFLRSGPSLVHGFLDCIPMRNEDKSLLVDRTLSVMRATLKGTFIIGAIQGALAGLAFFVAGIQGALFWGSLMAVLSIIPGVGAALVWLPAVVYLLAIGQVWQGLALAAWCVAVVGTADNVLRPRMVGKDTRMPDLLVLLSTLGGLSLFGIVGIILGPMVASVFVSVWGIYRHAFSELLQDAG